MNIYSKQVCLIDTTKYQEKKVICVVPLGKIFFYIILYIFLKRISVIILLLILQVILMQNILYICKDWEIIDEINL